MLFSNISRSILIMCCVGLLAACDSGGTKNQAAQQMPPVPVTVTTVARQDVPLSATYMGQTTGYLSVEVRAQTTGILMRRAFEEGSYVKEGQLLFEIDPATALAALDQANGQLALAQARLESAKSEFDRILPLYKRNAVSQRDRDVAQADYDSAKATLESAQGAQSSARIQLQHTQVLAPITGYTSQQARNVGNLITMDAQGSLLTSINQVAPMYLSFAIPSSEVLRMRRLEVEGRARNSKIGSKVTMYLVDGGRYPEEGVITFIDTQIDPSTSVVRAKAEFPNAHFMLLPGQFATVTLHDVALQNVIMVPQRAVLQTADGPMVYVVDSANTVVMKPVRLGDIYGSLFLLESGLEPGDKLLVDGIIKVRPGSVVAPMELPAQAQASPLPTPDSIKGEPQSAITSPAPALPDDLESKKQ